MKINKTILICSVLLIVIGLLMIYSSSNIWAEYKFNDPYKFIKNQFVFTIIGIILMIIINKININTIYKYSNHFVFISLILLILVLIPGIGVVRNGSRSWFGIGPFGIQPSEISKLSLIIFTSKYLKNNNKNIKYIKKGLLPILLFILLFISLIMLEPDFGTCMVIILTLVAIIFVSGPKLSLFVSLFIVGLIAITILIIIAPYRMARIVSYLNPWTDPLGSGFQIIQSLYAIAPSGILGTGFNNSIQKNFYLPEPQTDFIFSILSEELGFIGSITVIILYVILFTTCIKISLKQNELFKKYLSFGLSFGLILQTLLNLCVVTGIIPTTGVTLPFISYGGSSLLTSMISIAIILNISKET